MRLEWLEDILAVTETGSFSEAAERRRLTQSAFSRRIRNIETHLGVDLFDRTHKPVQLRTTLRDQRDQIARLAAMLRQLADDLRHGDRMSGNRIVIASQHALTTALTPGLIRRIEARHPGIHVRLRSANLDDCHGLLLSRQADVALLYFLADEGPPAEAEYVETCVFGADLLIPVASEALAARLTDPGDLPVIAYPSEVFLGRVLGRVILPRLLGRTVVPKVETALTLAALELAAEGLGVAWVPASLARPRIADRRIDVPAGGRGAAPQGKPGQRRNRGLGGSHRNGGGEWRG